MGFFGSSIPILLEYTCCCAWNILGHRLDYVSFELNVVFWIYAAAHIQTNSKTIWFFIQFYDSHSTRYLQVNKIDDDQDDFSEYWMI